MFSTQPAKLLPTFKKTLLSTMIGLATMGAYAAEEAEQTKDVEVISISGMRTSSLSAMNEKRASVNLVDAISLEDIGALPDNSVAETLERITGVSADRFKGGASEISIRGLGPFLGMSTINGRAISSGSGNRSVAFSQFPSELVNGVKVYKSQSAELLEGGVSGTVDLGTIRPVDYGKEKLQAEFKASYNDYQAKQNGDDGLGHKISFSYVNSFDLAGGQIGFAIGYAGGETPRPEDTFVGSSTLRPCNSVLGEEYKSNCTFEDDNEKAVDGKAVDGDYYFISNMQSYRQMESVEDNDALIAAIQWKPSESVDVNLDAQWSERYYYEDRHDLSFDDGRRKIHNWITDENHVLQSYMGETRIGNTNEYRDRNEEYTGFGINVKWQVSEDLSLTADAAYSGTERYQNSTRARFRSKRKYFNWEQSPAGDFPNITVLDGKEGDPLESFSEDIKSLAFYNDDSEARKYRFDIEDEISSFKLDAEYVLNHDIFKTIRAGVAYSSHTHKNFKEDSDTYATGEREKAAAIAQVKAEGGDSNAQKAAGDAAKKAAIADTLEAVEACVGSWPQKDYGDDANAPFTQWTKIDTVCAYNKINGDYPLDPTLNEPVSGDIDLTEDITSFYVMSNFETELGDMFLSGNVGVRYVQTDITSIGISNAYTSTVTDGIVTLEAAEGFETQKFENSFNNLLPSLNMTLEVHDDVNLRFAAYKAVSRPDMWFYGAGRNVTLNTSDSDFTSVEEALGSVSASGNPNLELLESDNFEFGVNWYFTEESMFSVALYNKSFSARMGAETAQDNITVDGQVYTATVSGLPTIYPDDSDINGIELSLVHQFAYLPAPFDGFGFSGSYNYADSDYKTPESGAEIVKADGVSEAIEPGNLPGLSKHVGNAQLYWEGDSVAARIAYKYRSDYLKPFGSDLGQTNRFVEAQKTVDFSLDYKINKHFKVKGQLMNLTGEPALQYRVAPGAYNQIEHSGRKAFLSVKYTM